MLQSKDIKRNKLMKNKHCISTILMLLVILLINGAVVSCTSEFTGSVTIENGNFKYEIADNGRNLHFTDKATGEDYLDSKAVSKCAYIKVPWH